MASTHQRLSEPKNQGIENQAKVCLSREQQKTEHCLVLNASVLRMLEKLGKADSYPLAGLQSQLGNLLSVVQTSSPSCSAARPLKINSAEKKHVLLCGCDCQAVFRGPKELDGLEQKLRVQEPLGRSKPDSTWSPEHHQDTNKQPKHKA